MMSEQVSPATNTVHTQFRHLSMTSQIQLRPFAPPFAPPPLAFRLLDFLAPGAGTEEAGPDADCFRAASALLRSRFADLGARLFEFLL